MIRSDSNPLAPPFAAGVTRQSTVNQEQPLPQLTMSPIKLTTALAATSNAQTLSRNPRRGGLTKR